MSSLSPAILSLIRGQFAKLHIPSAHEKVYKDECLFSFDSPFSDGGLYVNLVTLQGYGSEYFMMDAAKTGSCLYLHEKWFQVPIVPAPGEGGGAAEEPTKLAIGIAGGFITEAKFELVKEHHFVVVDASGAAVSIPLPNAEIPEFVSNVIQGIIEHEGMKGKMQLDTWSADQEQTIESRYARDLVQLPNGKKISQNPRDWRCEMSGDTENLWLNLSTGYIGGGRRNWDGSGGSGAALQHFLETGSQYPLCVKLGTITPHGADIYSYAADEDTMVKDPLLAQHLSHWGIDIMQLEKTDKTMGEMEVALNMKYDWSRILEGGEELQTLSGPGYVGLRNIGSSCYLNSLMQTLLVVPEIQARYLGQRAAILESAPADPSNDFAVQMSKLAAGVLTDKYVAPDMSAVTVMQEDETKPNEQTLEKYVVAPRMFKQLVGKGHQEFSSGRQQDASEYFQHLLEYMNRAERTCLSRITGGGGAPLTASIFEFCIKNRLQCQTTAQVKYPRPSQYNTLELEIPLDKALNVAEVELVRERKRARLESSAEKAAEEAAAKLLPDDEDVKLVVPFEACLQKFFQEEIIAYKNPSVGYAAPTKQQVCFKTFPRYLMVKLSRYAQGADWVVRKIDARVPVPETLDLSGYREFQGVTEDEVLMPEGGGGGGEAPVSAAETTADELIVAQLMGMGFPENGSRRAALATNNSSVENATSWVFEHMEDSNFNDPPSPRGGSGAAASASAVAASTAQDAAPPPAESISQLESMGFTSLQAQAALKATGNSLERAADWLFSHGDTLDEAVGQIMAASDGDAGAGGGSAASASAPLDSDEGAEGKYTLVGIISHMGRNTDCGHYVCHIKKEGEWALFNDDKVAKSKNPPLDAGFLYLFKRDDNAGVL